MIKKSKFFLLFIFFCLPILAFTSNPNKKQAKSLNTKQTTGFTENKGQVTDENGNLRSDIKYIYAAPGMNVIFKANSFSFEVYSIDKNQKISEASGKPVGLNPFNNKNQEPEEVTIRTHRIDVNLTAAYRNSQIIAQGKNQTYNNYYLAHTPEEGIQNVYSYNQLTYKNIWPNIDIVFYAKKEGELKYDIILHPGADIKDVQFTYAGTGNITLLNGKLNMQTTLGKIEESIPLSYLAESKEKVNIEYTKVDNNISFTGKYDKNKTLVIDPVIIWATYFGGNEAENSQSVATDKSGNIYLSGNTYSTANISTTGAYQTVHNGKSDVYLVKFNTKGVQIWSTYFGGSDIENNNSMALDSSSGNIYLTGETFSTSSIATSGAYQEKKGNLRDAYLAKFDSSGMRIWATYIGGNGTDYANSVAVDIYSNVLLTGKTLSPTNIATIGAHQTVYNNIEAYLMKFDSSGQKLWGTYYGGSGSDIGYSVTSDKAGNIYFGGQTQSSSDIATPGAYQTKFGGAFLAKFTNSGKRIWATYYGGNSNDIIKSITTDKDNNVYFCGITFSASSIASKNAHQPIFGGVFNDAFLAKFDSAGSRKWGSYYGGSGEEIANSVIADPYGNVFIAGHTNSSTGIATSGTYQDTITGDWDLFLAKFNSMGKRSWATYYGATGNDQTFNNNIALDNNFNIYLSGETTSSSSISHNAVHQSTYGGNQDAFLVKIYDEIPDAGILSIDAPLQNICGSITKSIYFTLKNYSEITTLDTVYIGWAVNGIVQKPLQYAPFLNAKETSFSIKLDTFTFDEGINNLKIWAYNPNNQNDIINTNDTVSKEYIFYEQPKASFNTLYVCENETLNINESSKINTGQIIKYYWDFGDGDTSTKQSPVKKYNSAGTYKIKLKVTSNNGCTDSIIKNITIYPLPDLLIIDSISERNVKFVVSDSSYVSYHWTFGDGDTSTDKNPLHRYPAVGRYKVNLRVINNLGCEKTFTHSVQMITNNIKNPEFSSVFKVNIFPNPFKESFILEYSLTKSSTIQVSIFDITGKEMATIVKNTDKPAGKYAETINSKDHNLKSGLYLLRFVVNDQVVTKQIIRVE